MRHVVTVFVTAVLFSALVTAGCTKKKDEKPAKAEAEGETKETKAAETPTPPPTRPEPATEAREAKPEETRPAAAGQPAGTQPAPSREGGEAAAPPSVAGSPRCKQRFKGMDTNGDGRVSLKEFLAAPHRRKDPKAVFAARDANKDGHLTDAEFCSGRRGRHGRRRRPMGAGK